MSKQAQPARLARARTKSIAPARCSTVGIVLVPSLAHVVPVPGLRLRPAVLARHNMKNEPARRSLVVSYRWMPLDE